VILYHWPFLFPYHSHITAPEAMLTSRSRARGAKRVLRGVIWVKILVAVANALRSDVVIFIQA